MACAMVAASLSIACYGPSPAHIGGGVVATSCPAVSSLSSPCSASRSAAAIARVSQVARGAGVGGLSLLRTHHTQTVSTGKRDARLRARAGSPVIVIASSSANGREELASELAYGPPADFYKVEAIVRPWRLSHCASALLQSGIRGVTVTDVRGFGSQGGSTERHAGSEFSEDSFVAKVKLEIVVSKDQVEVVVNTILDQARTGEIGDGKIFIIPVADVIRVRTGERGLKAERMAGGRSDLLSTTKSN